MSNRTYTFIVVTQVSLISFLLLFVLNAETVLDKIRNSDNKGPGYVLNTGGSQVTRLADIRVSKRY